MLTGAAVIVMAVLVSIPTLLVPVGAGGHFPVSQVAPTPFITPVVLFRSPEDLRWEPVAPQPLHVILLSPGALQYQQVAAPWTYVPYPTVRQVPAIVPVGCRLSL